MKFETGKTLESFVCSTICREGVKIEELVNGKPTMLLFLRFYGCRVSKADLWTLRAGYGEIEKTGGQVVVVLQTSRETMSEATKEKNFPFEVICDPERELYRTFEVRPANSEEEADSPISVEKVKLAERLGLERGPKEGDPLQLPASVLVDRDRIIRFVHYGEHEADTPTAEEIVKLLESCNKEIIDNDK